MSADAEPEVAPRDNGGAPDNPAAPGPPDGKSGKSKEEICLELAKLAQQSVENRRSYEWKVAFGLWTAIGLVTYFGVEHPTILSAWVIGVLGTIYLLLCATWFLVWQVPTRRAFLQDKVWKHYYMHKAEGLNDDRPSDITYYDVLTDKGQLAWTYGQSLITALFLAGSFFILLAANGSGSSDESKVDLKASGKNVEVTSKVVNK